MSEMDEESAKARATTLKISEGNRQCRTETAPKLKVDDPSEWSNVASLLFKHIDTHRFLLSKKACPVDDAPNKSGRAGVELAANRRDLGS
jgi:hypothetical protein